MNRPVFASRPTLVGVSVFSAILSHLEYYETFDEAIRPQLTEKVQSELYPENIEMGMGMIASGEAR